MLTQDDYFNYLIDVTRKSDTHISIFWGNAEDFLAELQRQMKK